MFWVLGSQMVAPVRCRIMIRVRWLSGSKGELVLSEVSVLGWFCRWVDVRYGKLHTHDEEESESEKRDSGSDLESKYRARCGTNSGPHERSCSWCLGEV